MILRIIANNIISLMASHINKLQHPFMFMFMIKMYKWKSNFCFKNYYWTERQTDNSFTKSQLQFLPMSIKSDKPILWSHPPDGLI